MYVCTPALGSLSEPLTSLSEGLSSLTPGVRILGCFILCNVSVKLQDCLCIVYICLATIHSLSLCVCEHLPAFVCDHVCICVLVPAYEC